MVLQAKQIISFTESIIDWNLRQRSMIDKTEQTERGAVEHPQSGSSELHSRDGEEELLHDAEQAGGRGEAKQRQAEEHVQGEVEAPQPCRCPRKQKEAKP